MNYRLSVLIALLLCAISAHAQSNPTPESVLKRTAARLATVKALGYTVTRELNYSSEDYLSKSTSTGYLELKATEGPHGFRYNFDDDDYIAVYNGSESFVAVKKRKIMQVNSQPPLNMLESSAVLYNSPLTLKAVLPKIIADAKIPKKLSVETVNGQRRYVVEFALQRASISGLGDIRELRSDRASIYHVAVDAKTFLPLEVLLTNDQNKDFTKTTFANMTERPKAPVDSSWYFSTYAHEYKVQQPDDKKLLEVGKTPPSFVLGQFESSTPVGLEKYSGKVVLLEFWIAHCGFCIAAVPKLNEIAKTFSSPDFEIVSINVHDPTATIASFKKRHGPTYTILADGEKTGDAYGVGSYPALVLIGKDGKIAYSSLGLFETELGAAIKATLAK
jgi:thiol-disulfide isomerase/thioredoxin